MSVPCLTIPGDPSPAEIIAIENQIGERLDRMDHEEAQAAVRALETNLKAILWTMRDCPGVSPDYLLGVIVRTWVQVFER